MKKIVSIVVALVLVSVLSVSAFAAKSVVADIITDFNGGTSTTTQDNSKNEFTFTADEKDGYNFVGWEIEGNYEIISGSLDSETITIRFEDDVDLEEAAKLATPEFKKVSDGGNKKPDGSPDTGDSMAVAALAVLALGGLVVSKKRMA